MNSLEQQLDCLELREEGIRLEYEYVNNLKDNRIQLLKNELEGMKIENELLKDTVNELEEQLKRKNYKLEQIENSAWWKLRNIIKRR